MLRCSPSVSYKLARLRHRFDQQATQRGQVDGDLPSWVCVRARHDLLRGKVYLHLSAQARIGDGQGLRGACPVGKRQP